jgi:transcriptional regulator with XRE-family HTH domain
LRQWRSARRMSQLQLALHADMSARHLSFVETGKAQPSREALARLADALAMPLRERNALLLAAGFAPPWSQRGLAAPSLERMRKAVELILQHQEPYPAFALTRRWEVLIANPATARVKALLMEGRTSRHTNLLHQVFDPEDMRAAILNWEEVAGQYIAGIHQEIASAPTDSGLRVLLEEILRYPGVPRHWGVRDLERDSPPLFMFAFRTRLGELRFFETITTFAGPRDLTLEDLRIECTFPADSHTAEVCSQLARDGEASASEAAPLSSPRPDSQKE